MFRVRRQRRGKIVPAPEAISHGIAIADWVGMRTKLYTFILVMLAAVPLAATDSPKSIPDVIGTTPRGQFSVFRDVFDTIREIDMADTSSTELHPFSRFLSASLEGATPDDTLSFETVTDSLVPLTWRLDRNLVEDTPEWMEMAFRLARGLHQVGVTAEAEEWLKLIDSRAPASDMRLQARGMLVHYYTVADDSAGMAWLVDSWRARYTEGVMGHRISAALLASLYVRGYHDLLNQAASKYVNLVVYRDFFKAYDLSRSQHYDEAKLVITRVLWWLREDSYHAYPISLKLAALTLAADLDWLIGQDAMARKEYVMLRQVEDDFVSDWATFMIASVAMHNDDYSGARDIFAGLCGHPTTWGNMACRLERHAKKMLELSAKGLR